MSQKGIEPLSPRAMLMRRTDHYTTGTITTRQFFNIKNISGGTRTHIEGLTSNALTS